VEILRSQGTRMVVLEEVLEESVVAVMFEESRKGVCL